MDPDLRRNDRSRKSKLNTMRSEWIQGELQKLDSRTIDAGIDRVRGVNSRQLKKRSIEHFGAIRGSRFVLVLDVI